MFGKARRARQALAAARVLDDVVESQLALVARLPEEARKRAAEHLAEMVLLAQAYRHYAQGWIDRRELDRRARAAADKLVLMRRPNPIRVHLTEPD
ncbi:MULTISPECIES: hypothetical protein [Actinokineospora]|uniref:Uncharacterized protein n=1 Tax=Actinokineospora fastidiosa TaxID=1816 RepID=A0A918G5D6_9PSEU|nr:MULTISPECIES: hypothetical protein [Actinokineospora]UVS76369.1 hypothetical protein Actkin_00053 [Actinokineospora sp. UTMC 2448]GGS18723.1 hypothetical protein GCM10010171_09080 [Actinokineospora fastidiosa]